MFLLRNHFKSILQANILHKGIKPGNQYYWYKIFEYHMITLTYFFPVIDSVSVLVIEFQLDYIEIVSIPRAFSTMLHIILHSIQTLMLIYYDIENHCEVLTLIEVFYLIS